MPAEGISIQSPNRRKPSGKHHHGHTWPCIQGGTMQPSSSPSVTVESSGASAKGSAWQSRGGGASAAHVASVCVMRASRSLWHEPPHDSHLGSSFGSCATERSACGWTERAAWCASCMLNANDSGGDSRQCRSMSVLVRRGSRVGHKIEKRDGETVTHQDAWS